MKSLKLGAIILGSVGLLFLGACSSNQAVNPEDSAASETETVAETTPKPTETVAQKKEGEHGRGGQIIESGEYHLEFVAAPSNNGTNIDFFLEKGEKHETVSDAKITAQVQLPSGEQKTIPIKWEANDKHYHGKLSETAAGEYKVAILSEVNGEKVNGRFSFKR
ncbi:MAG: hypothetical protein ACFCUV_15025 [Rivularia sp. (in: cyanobacteria)]